ncbi:hypothetical protein [Thalassospira alkalitolerans]|uniref:DUF7666 domain-containing protein n=1 Tax=Thalassospira alkalitolerans TaxID=1293890 RepID=UPI003AA8FAF9
MSENEPVKAIKGFNQNLKCRDFQFEIGKDYVHEGEVVPCESGFHSIEGHPLEVFSYYPPAKSRYCDVTAGGQVERHGSDSKIAAAHITIQAEITLPGIVNRAVKWVFDHAKWSEGPVATEDNEGVTASGRWGAATASGSQGAATASGSQGAATASGDQGAATASGDQGAATASGSQGAATASGRWGAATASGSQGKARAKKGCAIFLVERNDDYEIVNVFAGIAGKGNVKPDTWYRLEDGEITEVKD